MASRIRRHVLILLLLLQLVRISEPFTVVYNAAASSSSSSTAIQEVKKDVAWLDTVDDYDYNDEEDDDETPKPKTSRWESISPNVKAARERAIANKKKREPKSTKKRRMFMFVKERQREKKRDSKVGRLVPFANRTALSNLTIGSSVDGLVISLVDFGAYVDIGTECDGLLHVSQISHDTFIQHPRQVLSPGDNITVTIKSYDADSKKLHLTMLPPDIVNERNQQKNELDERIQLDELEVDDELWGEIRRVTDYGAYIEVGAVVDGFLHFMDHPAFGWSDEGEHPSEFMSRGERVRVWVAGIDNELRRIKLTAIRPTDLPGPRREL